MKIKPNNVAHNIVLGTCLLMPISGHAALLASFESGVPPWEAEGGVVLSTSSDFATDGTLSLKAENIPEGFNTVAKWFDLALAPEIANSTAITMDVFFEWPNRPEYAPDFSSGPYQDAVVALNSSGGGFVGLPAQTLNFGANSLTFEISGDQAAAFGSSTSFAGIHLILNAGTYGGAPFSGEPTIFFDNIRTVSTVPVPEPSALLLGLAGCLAFFRRRR